MQTQADNTNIGYVKVRTIDEARYAISQFHHKKIGYKRIHVSLINNDNNSTAANTRYMPMSFFFRFQMGGFYS